MKLCLNPVGFHTCPPKAHLAPGHAAGISRLSPGEREQDPKRKAPHHTPCLWRAVGTARLLWGGCGAVDWTVTPLQANLPLLQRELLHCARMAKQTPAQYLAQHEQLLLDANASSPIDSSELLLEVGESGKRRTPDRCQPGEGRAGFFRDASLKRGGCSGGGPTSSPPSRTKENGLDRDPLHPEHLSKRPCTMSPAQRYSPSNGLSHPPNGLGHPPAGPSLPQHYRLEDMAMAHHYRDTYRHPDPRELRERQRPAGEPCVSQRTGGSGLRPPESGGVLSRG